MAKKPKYCRGMTPETIKKKSRTANGRRQLTKCGIQSK